MKETDQLAALLPPQSIPCAERMNMPYLGYHLLRETLTTNLLGDSEDAILFWLGKNIGRKIPIQSCAGLVHPFIRLGLGQLDVREESSQFFHYSLTHTIYSCMSPERLVRALSLECGIIAGAIEQWQKKEPITKLELDGENNVRILVQL